MPLPVYPQKSTAFTQRGVGSTRKVQAHGLRQRANSFVAGWAHARGARIADG